MPESIKSTTIIEKMQKPFYSAEILNSVTFFIIDENGKLLFHGLPTTKETAIDYKEKKIAEIGKKKDTVPTTTTLDPKEKKLTLTIEEKTSPHTHAFISAKIYFQGKPAEIILMQAIDKDGQSNHAGLYNTLKKINKFISLKAKTTTLSDPTLADNLSQLADEIDLSPITNATHGNFKSLLGNYHFSGECHFKIKNKEILEEKIEDEAQLEKESIKTINILERYKTKKQELGLLADISFSLKGSQTSKIFREADYAVSFETIPTTLEKNKIYIEINDGKIFYGLINENEEKIKKLFNTSLSIVDLTPALKEKIKLDVIAFLKVTGEIGRSLETSIPIENIELRRDKFDSGIRLKTPEIIESPSPKVRSKFFAEFKFPKIEIPSPKKAKTLEEKKHDDLTEPSTPKRRR